MIIAPTEESNNMMLISNKTSDHCLEVLYSDATTKNGDKSNPIHMIVNTIENKIAHINPSETQNNKDNKDIDELKSLLATTQSDVNVNNIIKKRGRKPKVIVDIPKEPIELKKRGRKPTCKILNNNITTTKKDVVDECLIVQLPIYRDDIEKIINDINKKVIKNNDNTICINKNKMSLDFEEKQIKIVEPPITYNVISKCNNCISSENKIKELEIKYHIYSLRKADKKIYNLSINLEDIYSNDNIWESDKYNDICCWWCCYTFETLPIGLPEKYYNKIFKVIGIFCSFECALAYNMSLNDHKIWDRVSLLYHLRNLILKNIYPDDDTVVRVMDDIVAAAPRNILKIFGGILTIDEFRKNTTILKKQYRNIMPPIKSLIYQFEESTYNREQNLIIKPIKNNLFDKTELTYGRTYEQNSLVSVPTLVGRKTDEQNSSIPLTNVECKTELTFSRTFGQSLDVLTPASVGCKTDEQCSSVSVPTLVGRKTFGQSPDVQTLVSRKISGHSPEISLSTFNKMDTTFSKNSGLVLKRNKPIANKSSLITSMGIKFNE